MKSISFSENIYQLFNISGIKFNRNLLPLLDIGDYKVTMVNDLKFVCHAYNAEKTIFYFEMKMPEGGNFRTNTSQLLNANGEFVRVINSHKGGRTEIIPQMRVTEEEKSLVDKARAGMSYSDFIVESANKKLEHHSRQKAK